MSGVPRRAEWREIGGEPATIAGWMPRILLEMPSLILLFAALLATLGWMLGSNELVGGAVATILVGAILPYRSPRPSGSLPTLPFPPGSRSVGVTVRHRGHALGADDAIATFVEGWLHVEGRRTSFSLRATDVRARISLADGSIVLDGVGGESVRIEPMLLASQFKGSSPVRQTVTVDKFDEFRRAARGWIADQAAPEGTAILPPLRVHPSAYARKLVRAGILVPTGVVATLAILHSPAVRATPFLVFTLWILMLFTVLVTVASWSALRRLDPPALPENDGKN